MGSNRLAMELFGMLKIRKDRIPLSYMYACGARKKKEERRRKKMDKIEIFNFGLFKVVKG